MTERLARGRPPAPADESDAEVMTRLVKGEMGALGVLYDRHYLPILRFVQRATRGGHDAEDIAQEAFLTASRVAHAYDGRESCRPWLYGIAARLILHRSRRIARMGRFLNRLTSQSAEPSPSPQDAFLHGERRTELETGLVKLSAEKRVVLVMADVEGLTCNEIATALGIPVGTVWTRLHHARRDLRKRLERGRS